MILKSVSIDGLRGFAREQSLHFAIPNGRPGSGLTIIVGANNTGKSTVIEALRAIVTHGSPRFAAGRRNQVAGDRVIIAITDEFDKRITLSSIGDGSSQTERSDKSNDILRGVIVIPSRRGFSHHFPEASAASRDDYARSLGFPGTREASANFIVSRLFRAEKNKEDFNRVLSCVLDPVPEWSIDLYDTGQHYLKMRKGSGSHGSEGLGEGLISLWYIIDALYDSEPGHLIAVDEPELALHPALQRKLCELFVNYAKDRQIVIATHSPYLISMASLIHGANVARTHLVDNASMISQLSSSRAKTISKLLNDKNNPHIFGIQAQEIFFVSDRVILVEGQEDIVFFRTVEKCIKKLNGNYFGWGVGGASNLKLLAGILHDLGYSQVVGIVDSDKENELDQLRNIYPLYHFFAIPAEDVRTKKPRPCQRGKKGLLNDENKEVRPEYRGKMISLFDEANSYLMRDGTSR